MNLPIWMRVTWQYARTDFPAVLRAVMELSLVVPLFYALMPWAGYWPPSVLFLLLLCLWLLPYNLARLLTIFDRPAAEQSYWQFAGMVAAVVLSIRTLIYRPDGILDFSWVAQFFDHLTNAGYPFWNRDFGVLGIVLYAWWRGLSLMERRINVRWVGLSFRVRALILAPTIIYLSVRRTPIDLTPFIWLFGITSLLALAVARVEEVQQDATGLRFAFTPRWIATIGGAALIVVVVAGGIAQTAAAEQVTRGPQTAVALVLYATGYTLAYLLAPLVFPLLDWLGRVSLYLLQPIADLLANLQLGGDEETPPEMSDELAAGAETLEGAWTEITALLPAAIFVLIVIIIMLGIVLSFRRARGERETEKTGRRAPSLGSKSMDSRPSLLNRLTNLIPNLREWRAARSIRRIYQQMVYVATHDGHPRLPAETPYEYLPRLAAVWPAGKKEVQQITDAYVRVRYGQIPESRAELQSIHEAWARLEKQLRERDL